MILPFLYGYSGPDFSPVNSSEIVQNLQMGTCQYFCELPILVPMEQDDWNVEGKFFWLHSCKN